MYPLNSNININNIDKEYGSDTWIINYEKNKISHISKNHSEQIKQAVYLILSTPKFIHRIYSFNYGFPINHIINNTVQTHDIKNYIKDSLLNDDRIISVENIWLKKINDSLHISLDVYTKYAKINIEEMRI